MDKKIEILARQVPARRENVLIYQVNIDKYKLAIVEAEKYPDMREFIEELKQRVKSEQYQQNREKIMLSVIESQLEGVDISLCFESQDDA